MQSKQTNVWDPMVDNDHYRNPIISADYSDPDVLAIDDDYYMVASSFNHIPGLPLLHSNDLVHWQLVNHVIENYANQDYTQPQFGCGAWAPSIRFHNGLFWVFFAIVDEGIFQCHSSTIEGRWSEPHCVVHAKGWIDPCPFWDDDGRAWLVHAFAHSRSGIKHRLQLCEMAPDATQLYEFKSIVYDGAVDAPTIEGPKVYKRQGHYYIFAPAGGVESGWQCVLRAKAITGPYQLKIALQQADSNTNGPHQGGWVHTCFGEDWFIHFQDKGYLGRVVHLEPMHWDNDGWPVIGQSVTYYGMPTGQPVSCYRKPKSDCTVQGDLLALDDDFKSHSLNLLWQWQANVQLNWYRLNGDGLQLNVQRMPLRDGQFSIYDASNLLLAKFPAPQFVATTALHENFTENSDMAGLIVYGLRYAALALQQIHGRRTLVFLSGWLSDSDVLHTRIQEIMPWPDKSISLCVRQVDSLCWFGYRNVGEPDYQFLDKPFACSAGKWVGAKLGLFALSEAPNSQGYGLFELFCISRISANRLNES